MPKCKYHKVLSLILFLISCIFISETSIAKPSQSEQTDLQKLLAGDVIILASQQKNQVFRISAKIWIPTRPEPIWQVLTDYDRLSNHIPKLKKSQLISAKANEKIVFQKGRTGVFLFYRTTKMTLKIHEKKFTQIDFEQLKGDFKVYRGRWTLQPLKNIKGTILCYEAEIKPDFFAPHFMLKYIEKRDVPVVLRALKKKSLSQFNLNPNILPNH